MFILNKSKIIQTLLKASIIYSIIRIIIQFVFQHDDLYYFLYYYISNDFSWIFSTLILPLVIAISIGQNIKSILLTNLGKLFLPILLVLTIVGCGLNKYYWGYYFKRPSLFAEVKDANEIISITMLEKKYDEEQFKILSNSISSNNYYNISDLYELNFKRAFMVFENLPNRGNLSDYKEIANDKNLKLSPKEISQLQKLVINSSFVKNTMEGKKMVSNGYDIQVIEFVTSKERYSTYVSTTDDSIRHRKPILEFDNRFFLVSIEGGEVSNDHYPFIELLIKDNKIIKKQKYFFDVAGMETTEYSFFAPFLEIVGIFISIVLFGIYKLTIILKKRWLQNRYKY